MKPKKILIIDDEPDVITYLTTVLEAHGFITNALSNVRVAMLKVKEFTPDLICLDIMMPQETGISFYVKLKKDKNYSKIPVIIISGVVESEKFDFRLFVSDKTIPPPDYYMEKPINVNKFIDEIEQLIG